MFATSSLVWKQWPNATVLAHIAATHGSLLVHTKEDQMCLKGPSPKPPAEGRHPPTFLAGATSPGCEIKLVMGVEHGVRAAVESMRGVASNVETLSLEVGKAAVGKFTNFDLNGGATVRYVL